MKTSSAQQSSGPPVRCGRNTKTCKGCGYRYQKADPKGPDATCPQCGHPRPCERSPMANGACRLHGGMSPKGMEASNYQGKGYSKYLRGDLKAKYDEAMTDIDLMDIRGDLALMHARLCELLDGSDTSDLWQQAQDTWNQFKEAFAKSDMAALGLALDQLDILFNRGLDEQIRWKEVYYVQDQLNRIRDSERRRLIEMRQMISAEQAMMLVMVLVNAIRENVSDKAARLRIGESIIRVVGNDAGGRLIGS